MVVAGAAQVARRSTAQGVGDDVGRNRAVALELSALGLVVATQQGGVRDDDAELESR